MAQKIEYNRNIEKYLVDVTSFFLSQLEQHPSDSKPAFLDHLLKIFDDIVNHPYVDKYRIIDPSYQTDPIIFKKTFCINFFKHIGFLEEMNNMHPILIYPYNAPIQALITVQNSLKEIGKGALEYSDKLEVSQMNNFEIFLKFQYVLDIDLLNKSSKNARIAISLNLDEIKLISGELQIKTLKEMLLLYSQNPQQIEKTFRDYVVPLKRADLILRIYAYSNG